MNGDELKDLAAGYALGALDGGDRQTFEARLGSGDREAARLLLEYEQAVATLVAELADSPPPPAVKDALLARIDAEGRAAGRRPAEVIALPVRKSVPAAGTAGKAWWDSFAVGAIAAGILSLVAGYSFVSGYREQYRKLEADLSAIRQEMAGLIADRDDFRATIEAQRVYAELVKNPSTQIVFLKGLDPDPRAAGRMLWQSKAGGVFVATGLPVPPAGKTYQLWAIQGANAPVSAGVFAPKPDGSCELNVNVLPVSGTVDVFAVTLEPEGGLPAPSGPMYLAGKGGI